MAEILILAQDKHMPTVEQWRRAMTERAVPQADKFLSDYPDVPSAIANWTRYQAFRQAASVVEMATVLPDRVSPDDLSKAVSTVNEYLSNPVRNDLIDRARVLHQDRSWIEPSIATQWKYHRNIIDVESRKTDLVKAVELAEKDRRGCAKRGDFIEVSDDGADWGRACKPPKWVLLKIPPISKERVRKYIQPEYRQEGFEEDGTTPRMALYRKREWHFLVDNIPLVARQKLARDGELTIGPTGDYTWLQVKTFVHNKRTNLSETEDL